MMKISLLKANNCQQKHYKHTQKGFRSHTHTLTSYWGLWWVIQTVKTLRLQRGFWETWSPPSELVQTASHGPEERCMSAYTREIMCCVLLQWVIRYLIIKGKASTHHLIHNDSQTPPVHGSPVIIVLQYLINTITLHSDTWSIVQNNNTLCSNTSSCSLCSNAWSIMKKTL